MDGNERILYRLNKKIVEKLNLHFRIKHFRFTYFPRFLFIKDYRCVVLTSFEIVWTRKLFGFDD